MSKLKWHILLALWLAFCGTASAEQLYINESGWWYEGGAFNASGTPIQAAVDAAGEGDMIYVWNGSYSENVDVDKRLTLEGEGADVVTVWAADSADHIFNVTANYVNISGFIVKGAMRYLQGGIHLCNASHCNIHDNTASNNRCGIYMHDSCNYNMLQGNIASNNEKGIYLHNSNHSILTNNTANLNNRYGIHLSSSNNNTLTNNTIDYSNTDHGYGVCLAHSNSNTLTNNNASNNHFGIRMVYSSSNTLTNNNASNNDYGINLQGSCNYNTLQDNLVSNNWYGIYLCYSGSNTLLSNTANSNNGDGICLYHSGGNTLLSNTMSGNAWNFDVGGYAISDYTQNIDTSNTVNGKPIYYWIDQQNQQMSADAGYVGIVNCVNITIKDLTLMNNGQGILFAYTENSRIENVTVSNNRYGIHMAHSGSNILTSNNASNNTDGVYLYYSSENTFLCNTANSNSRDGIHLLGSSSNTLLSNTMSGNAWNFDVGGYAISDYTQNIDTSNTVNGKPIYYWIDQQNQQMSADAGYVGIVNCVNITVKDLTLMNNGQGILFTYTENSRIENVTVSNNRHGIYLLRSSSNMLTNNNASNNMDYGYGIYLLYSSKNTLTNNIANSNNNYGISLSSSSKNTLMGNTANLNSRDGIYLLCSSSNTLMGNTANSNSWYGITLCSSSHNNDTACNLVQNNIRGGFCLSDGSTDNNISYNNVIENGNYDVATGGWEWQFRNYQSNHVEANNNYWGAGMNNSTIDASIYDDEDGGRGEVEFYPFETDPVPCAQTLEESPAFTATDTTIALQIAVGSRPHDPRYDVSGDGSVTSLDALMILQIAAGSTEQSPEEKAYLHLYEQMDRYGNGSTLRLIRSYVGTPTNPDDCMAWVYDNDLTVLALIDRGTPEDLSRAKILCDSLIWCQNHDQDFNDGRIRDGYWANNLKDSSGENSSIKSPGTGTGNMAWTIIALLRYYEVTGDTTYLNSSKRLGDWIYNNCNDTRGAGGYTGGYTDWQPQKHEWKSTEHNIDVYVAFMKLHEATINSTWRERATYAKTFVEYMWNESEGHFWTGTMNDGTTINRDVKPLDVNTWAVMALDGANISAINNWIETNCQTTCCGFEGFDFNCDRDGIWFEGTAQMCIDYQIGNDTEKSDEFIEELRGAQTSANNSNGKGMVAACHDNVSTGFGWSYPNAPHIGATAWYIFAERELNPYWGLNTGEPIPLDEE